MVQLLKQPESVARSSSSSSYWGCRVALKNVAEKIHWCHERCFLPSRTARRVSARDVLRWESMLTNADDDHGSQQRMPVATLQGKISL